MRGYLSPCAEPGCPVSLPHGVYYCDDHKKDRRSQYRPASGWEWSKVKRRVLREEPMCQIGGPGCLGISTEVDHVIELQDGGEFLERSNLRGTCHVCHVKRPRRDRPREEPRPRPARAYGSAPRRGEGPQARAARRRRGNDSAATG